MKRFIGKPTPATVIACIALFVSLGGVGYAAATIGSAQIKNNSVSNKDLKNNDVRSKDIRTGNVGSSDIKNDGATGADVLESSLGKVPSASSADNANSANSAGNANTVGGRTAASLDGPPAYAHVQPDGTVDAAGSKNVTSANVSVEGSVFCFNLPSVNVRNVQATVDYLGGGFEAIPHASTQAAGDSGTCPGAEDVSLVFIDGVGGDTFEAAPPFNIVFFD